MRAPRRASLALYCAGMGLLLIVASSYEGSLTGIFGGLLLCALAFVLAMA